MDWMPKKICHAIMYGTHSVLSKTNMNIQGAKLWRKSGHGFLVEIHPLRRILGKSFWSSCVRFTFTDLLTNTYTLTKKS